MGFPQSKDPTKEKGSRLLIYQSHCKQKPDQIKVREGWERVASMKQIKIMFDHFQKTELRGAVQMWWKNGQTNYMFEYTKADGNTEQTPTLKKNLKEHFLIKRKYNYSCTT